MWKARSNLDLTLLEFNLPENSSLDATALKSKCSEILGTVGHGVTWSEPATQTTASKLIFTSFVGEPNGIHVIFRVDPEEGLLTVDIQEKAKETGQMIFTTGTLAQLSTTISTTFSAVSMRPLVKIPRTSKVPNVYFNSAQQILTYDFDQTVFDQNSEYQNVKILHSKQFGNTLILDDMINLAESDISYTHSVMQKGVIPYEGKEVLILGGGDGALIHEILKENPKFVTMIDIDKMVIDACKEHMRSVCGDSMDELKGKNYEIIVGDCFAHLEPMKASGKKFDVVIGDLTDTPLIGSEDSEREFWKLMKLVLQSSFDVLQPHGHFLTHVCGIASPSILKGYETMLQEQGLQFKQSTAMVPSFLEIWAFYKVWKNSS